MDPSRRNFNWNISSAVLFFEHDLNGRKQFEVKVIWLEPFFILVLTGLPWNNLTFDNHVVVVIVVVIVDK